MKYLKLFLIMAVHAAITYFTFVTNNQFFDNAFPFYITVIAVLYIISFGSLLYIRHLMSGVRDDIYIYKSLASMECNNSTLHEMCLGDLEKFQNSTLKLFNYSNLYQKISLTLRSGILYVNVLFAAMNGWYWSATMALIAVIVSHILFMTFKYAQEEHQETQVLVKEFRESTDENITEQKTH